MRAAVLGLRCGITFYHESQKPEDFRAISPENALGMLLLLRDESGQSKREVSITVYAATDFMREIYEVVRQATRLRPRRLVFTAELDRCVADLNFRDEAHGDARVVAVKVLWEQNLRADSPAP